MRHTLISSKWKCLMITSIIFFILNTMVFGVPLSMSYSNQKIIKNEYFGKNKERDGKKLVESSCMVNGLKYIEGEPVPGAGPCEECICHPPNVVCSMMKCPINIGCITIQLPNKCCPKYKCDCEHKGKQYNNGEKINKTDESACRVCFCNGGEIVCTSIVCYTRNDCQGYYLPGDCCPKYDNCSSASIEQKQKDSIDFEKSSTNNHYWSYSTEQNYNEDNIWKRDTVKSQEYESPSVSKVVVTMPSTSFNHNKGSRQINISLNNNVFEELNASTSSSILRNNITHQESDNEMNTTENLEIFGNLNITESSKTSFLGFENNLTDNEQTTESRFITNTEIPNTISQFEELFDSTTDIDDSVIITHTNGTETIIGITEAPTTEEAINSSIETTNTQVEVFNPNDLRLDTELDTEETIIEFSTATSELDVTTEMDYEESREATTPRAPNKSTVGTPHKLVINSSPKTIVDQMNTEIIFTNLEDTTDMFEPNFDYRSYKTQPQQIPMDSETVESQIKGINYATTVLLNSEIINEITTEGPQNELFSQPFKNLDNKSIENTTAVDDAEIISDKTNNTTQMLNSTIFLELETKNITQCVNKSCNDHLKLNDELLDSQIESSSTTPFIIETKVLPTQDSPRKINKKMPYPKEYPDEFETIQNGPSLTITKRTYTSIPDIVYTTTMMVTLPTLELIYKADKEIEKYYADMQSTTIKPNNNNLSPLQNVSALNPT